MLPFLVVYPPPGQDCFRMAPVRHAPDAVRSPLPGADPGLRVPEPGETLRARLELSVQEARSSA